MKSVDAICLAESDNVATVLRTIRSGERIAVSGNSAVRTITVIDNVQFCHKISLVPLKKDDTVFKYGQAIGAATVAIPAGAHVHTQNMRSKRA